jgi:SpoVK/Ycf46/Vps4 family AAA+-type ATPase
MCQEEKKKLQKKFVLKKSRSFESNLRQMSEKRIKAYEGVVSPETLVFTFPASNKKNVMDVLTRDGRIDKLILVDEEEEAQRKAQQDAILAKFSVTNDDSGITVKKKPSPKTK